MTRTAGLSVEPIQKEGVRSQDHRLPRFLLPLPQHQLAWEGGPAGPSFPAPGTCMGPTDGSCPCSRTQAIRVTSRLVQVGAAVFCPSLNPSYQLDVGIQVTSDTLWGSGTPQPGHGQESRESETSVFIAVSLNVGVCSRSEHCSNQVTGRAF